MSSISRRFITAKRFKFINTAGVIEGKGSIEVNPTTSLILHPTTDLVASPEGNFDVKTDVDMNQKNVLNAPNILTRVKVRKSYSDFTAASADEKLSLILASMGDTILDITAKLATPFKYDNGPATVLGSIYRMSVGDMSDLTSFNHAQLCGSSTTAPSILFTTQKGGNFYKIASTLRMHKTYTAATSIQCKINASGGFFVASLTQGEIDFYIDMIKAPS